MIALLGVAGAFLAAVAVLVIAGNRCEAVLMHRVKNVPVRDVQCDEIWSYVGKKEGHKNPFQGDDMYLGDAWCFIAIEQHSKLVLTFELGKRTEGSTNRFMSKLATATSAEEVFQLNTDGFPAYPSAVYRNFGDRVNHAKVVKVYAQSAEGEARYSAPEVVQTIKTAVYGNPDMARACTSHIERQNGSLRLWCKRLARLTYAFSKKWAHHKAALALHFAYYNFVRIHGSLKATPAMAAGIAERPWTLAEVLA